MLHRRICPSGQPFRVLRQSAGGPAVLVAACVAFASLCALSGCAATQVAIAKRDLDVQTRMSATIFLDPVRADQRTVLVQVRNTSDRPDLDPTETVIESLRARGYSIEAPDDGAGDVAE